MLNYERKSGIVGNYFLWSKIHEQEEVTKPCGMGYSHNWSLCGESAEECEKYSCYLVS